VGGKERKRQTGLIYARGGKQLRPAILASLLLLLLSFSCGFMWFTRAGWKDSSPELKRCAFQVRKNETEKVLFFSSTLLPATQITGHWPLHRRTNHTAMMDDASSPCYLAALIVLCALFIFLLPSSHSPIRVLVKLRSLWLPYRQVRPAH